MTERVTRMRAEVHAGFWWGKLRERDHLENLGVDRMILKRNFKKYYETSADWIDVAQERRTRGVNL